MVRSQISAEFLGLVFVGDAWLLPPEIILLAAEVVSGVGAKIEVSCLKIESWA